MLASRLLEKFVLLSIVSVLLVSSIAVTQVNAAPLDQAGPPSGGPTGYVAVGRLNIRSGAGTGYPVVAVAHFKEVLSLTGRNAATTWLRIRRANGQEGWASAAYIVASAAHLAALPIIDDGWLPPVPPPSTQPVGQVTAYRLNVRAGPSRNASPVGTLHRGEWVRLLGRDTRSAWLQIRQPGKTQGWVSARYIRSGVPIHTLPVTGGPVPNPCPGKTRYVAVPKLNVRSGPGLHYGILGWLYRGQRVQVLDHSYDGRWLKVEIKPGFQGWVYGRYVQSTVPDPFR